MHDTLHANVKGNIDRSIPINQTKQIQGWSFHTEKGILALRAISDKETFWIVTKERDDVVQYYNKPEIKYCGWDITIPNENVVLEMRIDDVWIPIFKFDKENDPLKLDSVVLLNSLPSFVVADNVYKNPDSVREFALRQTFNENPEYHKGKRSNKTFLFPGLKERFEQLLGKKIVKWESFGINGIFQYCTAGEQLVYHNDTQQYAGVLFLTPDAPPNTGTTFYRSKNTKNMKVYDDYSTVYPHGHLDSTDFDVVDVVGNVYNRVVLFDGKLIHAASAYFGNSLENSRLFQLFFFECD